jgi:hypothetical protein
MKIQSTEELKVIFLEKTLHRFGPIFGTGPRGNVEVQHVYTV